MKLSSVRCGRERIANATEFRICLGRVQVRPRRSGKKLAVIMKSSGGWRDGSEDKSAYRSCRGPESGPHIRHLTTAWISNSRGLTPSGLLRHLIWRK